MASAAFDAFMSKVRALAVPPRLGPLRELRPQTDAARIALLKIALDQFLLAPGAQRVVGRDVWEFAQSVREDC